MCLATMLTSMQHAQYMLLLIVLAVNSGWFQILQSYMCTCFYSDARSYVLLITLSNVCKERYEMCWWISIPVVLTGHYSSLIPSPPIIHFLITCTVQEQRGKAWFNLLCEWCQCLHLGRQRGWGALTKRRNWNPFLIASVQTLDFQTIMKWLLAAGCLGWTVLKIMYSFNPAPVPSSVYLGRHWLHSHDKVSLPSPSFFGYCKQWKTGQWRVLANPACRLASQGGRMGGVARQSTRVQ